MLFHISSLNYLRTFTLAAKHLSFKTAATILNISPTAVSHQIKALEEQLRVTLFERQVRSITLTLAGQKLADACHVNLAEIDYVVKHLTQDKNEVSISCCHSFAALWLTPKSSQFNVNMPEYSLNIFASDSLVDIDKEKHLDIAIRYGSTEHDNNEDFLYTETISLYQSVQHPVVNSSLKKTNQQLFVTYWPENEMLNNIPWQQHFDASAYTVKTFPQEFFVLQAVMTGQGVGLLSDVLATSAVEHGWITKVDNTNSFKGYSYWLRISREHQESLRVKRATQWIKHEFSKLIPIEITK
ncbi:LysR family transcriptional regulator [Thalassotalea marina]|uniref:LysR family transcriptional regulator n=1 Tax=Thalassotalea marina TaxID=1673741 RepID=UPI0016762411|nr:LysR family transcriptional regulator [Thalassotalea marina]